MRLISITTSDADVIGCDYAVIDLTVDLARVALQRINAFNAQKAADPDLNEMYFWDFHAEYFSPWEAEEEGQADSLGEMLDGLPEEAPDLMSAPPGFTVPETVLARIECCQIIVREDAIAFIAIPKHTDSYVHTAEIPLHLIEAAALA